MTEQFFLQYSMIEDKQTNFPAEMFTFNQSTTRYGWPVIMSQKDKTSGKNLFSFAWNQ